MSCFAFLDTTKQLRGPEGLAEFKKDLTGLIEQMKNRQYNGDSAPELVFFSPIAHENLETPNLPDGTANNQQLAIYSQAMQEICARQSVGFVDLFQISQRLYQQSEKPLTMNGIHLLDHGNRLVAREIIPQLFGVSDLPTDLQLARLREAILEKNYYWFSRYRVVDGYNVFGGRSKLAWFGQSNADVMKREMEIFDVMTANRDQRVWAVAQGDDLEVTDDNLPPLLVVKTNKEGPLEGGAFPYLGAEEAISKMTVHDGMQVNLFASEEEFPRLINPVQMAVDTDSRLWVSVWESYPHWNPTQPRKDALVILPDENRDGKADDCIIFADELNSITGFEFWGGGVLVAAPPEIWFLKDTDGDDKADLKIRMLQGISSADSHHSANALLIGPDGWLYFSRGIFNVANFETPTQTYRSERSGVHRFNPRTFEVEFHFPIGPNPHGDVFDRWGYQFANDGTGGTGSYINIGKGIGNKQWFQQRIRPVPANGILSSSHFPSGIDGNFLISNAIGFLGVAQHKIQYDGADITCKEIEPILYSDDPNFRPSDMEVGGDGALYISDWHNSLIGHMQHNMRDPNRDHTHGRVYRVTYADRDLLQPPKMKGKPIAEVCENFFSRENGTRYRARLELSGRDTPQVIIGVNEFASQLDPKAAAVERDQAQALLECLWVHEEHRVPNLELLQKVFQAEDPRVRAAAIRTLGHWFERLNAGEQTLIRAARDESALVRAEALKAAVELKGPVASEAFFEVATRKLDPELNTVIRYAKRQLDIEDLVQNRLSAGSKLSAANTQYVLENGSMRDLLRMAPTTEVYRAILQRNSASVQQLDDALTRLAKDTNASKINLLVELINNAQNQEQGNVAHLGQLLASQPIVELKKVQKEVEDLAINGANSDIKRSGYAAWVAAAGPDDAFLAASKNRERLRDFLDAVPSVNLDARKSLYPKIEPLIFELPISLSPEATGGRQSPGVEANYYSPHARSAAIEELQDRQPVATSTITQFELTVPDGQTRDKFSNLFRSNLLIPKSGTYRFFTTSDDGSRLYIGNQLVVDNDGDHGMQEESGEIELSAGSHPIAVVYFNSGGSNGLAVEWEGPGFKKQAISSARLMTRDADSLHDIAIRALSAIPGREAEKFNALTKLMALGRNRSSAITGLLQLPPDSWNKSEVGPLVDNLLAYLSEMPARYRTSGVALEAMKLTRSLGTAFSKDDANDLEQRLSRLDVRVIAIGTVPHRMIYDKEIIVVEAGKPVEFRFSNTDSMPHNFAITVPGALQEIGELAEATANTPDAQTRHYIPVSDKILLSSKLLQPGQDQALSFEAPTEVGVYPYVCTYPGHWRRMHGALYVVASFEEYAADPDEYLANHPLPIMDEMLQLNTRGQEWKVEDLIGDVKMPMKRSYEVGQAAFRAANCIACHKFNGEGQVFGPDLATLDDQKRNTEYLLRAIIEPSKDIDEKYSTTMFLLADGQTKTGMVMEEGDDDVKIVIDPLAKDQLTIIAQEDIDARKKSDISPMPMGMVDKLSREEIIDLIAYIYSRGDEKHKMFEGSHDHHGQ